MHAGQNTDLLSYAILKQEARSNHFIQHHYRKTVYLLLFAIAFLAVRLTNLTVLPPYVDEWLHINRAFTVLKDGQLFVYTEGGKFLQIWLITPAVALSNDPIWSTRVVSVIAGLLAAIGCYFLGKTLFERPEGGDTERNPPLNAKPQGPLNPPLPAATKASMNTPVVPS